MPGPGWACFNDKEKFAIASCCTSHLLSGSWFIQSLCTMLNGNLPRATRQLAHGPYDPPKVASLDFDIRVLPRPKFLSDPGDGRAAPLAEDARHGLGRAGAGAPAEHGGAQRRRRLCENQKIENNSQAIKQTKKNQRQKTRKIRGSPTGTRRRTRGRGGSAGWRSAASARPGPAVTYASTRPPELGHKNFFADAAKTGL